MVVPRLCLFTPWVLLEGYPGRLGCLQYPAVITQDHEASQCSQPLWEACQGKLSLNQQSAEAWTLLMQILIRLLCFCTNQEGDYKTLHPSASFNWTLHLSGPIRTKAILVCMHTEARTCAAACIIVAPPHITQGWGARM